MSDKQPMLAGVRVIECSLLGPAAITSHLADLGADVIKVEPPAGDYVPPDDLADRRGHRRCCTCTSTGASSRSCSTCKQPEAIAGVRRPRARRRRRRRGDAARASSPSVGLGYERLQGAQPARSCSARSPATARPARTRTCRATASPTTRGPGIVQPVIDDDGFTHIPEHANIGINAGPAFGALGDPRRAHPRARRPARAPAWRSRSPTPPRTSTGTASRRGRRYETPRRRGHRQPDRQLRAARARPRRHVGGRALPVLRVVRRPRPVHGVGAGVLEELLRGRRPRWTCSRSGRARPVRRPRPRQHGAAGRSARHLPHAHDRRSGSTFGDEHNTPIAPVEHAEDDRATTRSSRTGSAWTDVRADRAPTCCCSRCTSRARSCRCPTKAPDGRRAHRRGAARRARLRRRQARQAQGHRRAPGVATPADRELGDSGSGRTRRYFHRSVPKNHPAVRPALGMVMPPNVVYAR